MISSTKLMDRLELATKLFELGGSGRTVEQTRTFHDLARECLAEAQAEAERMAARLESH